MLNYKLYSNQQKIWQLRSWMMLVILLTGCAEIQSKRVEQDSLLARLDSCEQFYKAHSAKVKAENIRDIQATQLSDFPFLSFNRLLVSFKGELDNSEKLDFWLSEAARLNLQARAAEWNNMSAVSRNEVQLGFLKTWDFERRSKACSEEWLSKLTTEQKQQIVEQARVKDDYSTVMRALGLYPLTSLFVSRQINKHQSATKAEFSRPLNSLPVRGKLQRYQPAVGSLAFSNSVKQQNSLGIPFVSQFELNELFNRYAPVIEVDETVNADKIGNLRLNKENKPYVDTETPSVYIMPSYTRFNSRVLLQLNYFFWFPERPFQSKSDIYAGNLDGIIWRVTLDDNLKPIVFDSVHNCGCYHKFYLTHSVKFKEQIANQEREPPFVAQANLEVIADKPWVLKIDSVQHFIQRIYQQEKFDESAKDYQMLSYQQLRSLQGENQSKSLFDGNGIVPSSARLERFLLWPMGVPSAGAMRQWGHHAVAFVGRRYFDEPFLLDNYFEWSAKE